MVEASGFPGICRSNTGVAETEEPCTNRIVPRRASLAGSVEGFLSCLCQRNSFTLSGPMVLTVQCSVPDTSARAVAAVDCWAFAPPAKEAVASVAVAARKPRRELAGDEASCFTSHFGISTKRALPDVTSRDRQLHRRRRGDFS